MACTISISLVSEHVDGEIGNDWKYSLSAEAVGMDGSDSARLDVPQHKLSPGLTSVPPNREAVTLRGGDCGTPTRVVLTLVASEVDWVFSDTGEQSVTVELSCPGTDQEPIRLEREIAAHVEERPRMLGGSANLLIKVRLITHCG